MITPSWNARQAAVLRLHWSNSKNWMIYPQIAVAALLLAGSITKAALTGGSGLSSSWFTVAFLSVILFYVRAAVVTFPYMAAQGVTRWEFYSSTILFVVLFWLASTFAGGIVAAAEYLTNGWGLDITLFSSSESLWRSLVFAGDTFIGSLTGALFLLVLAAAYQRWGLGGTAAAFAGYMSAGIVVAGLTYLAWGRGGPPVAYDAIFTIVTPAVDVVLLWLIMRRTVIR